MPTQHTQTANEIIESLKKMVKILEPQEATGFLSASEIAALNEARNIISSTP